MLNLEKINAEVFIARDSIVCWGAAELEFIRHAALISPRKRARICSHKDNEEPLHEMLIALAAGGYVRPHKHPTKAESLHVLEGAIDVFVFTSDGALSRVIPLSGSDATKAFYYRLPPDVYHTVMLRSDSAVIHEVTLGPFGHEHTIQAPFAPAEVNIELAQAYMDRLSAEEGNIS